MGNVIEMKRKVTAQIARFGHSFRIEYQVGRTPELSDPAAALYIDNIFHTWATVGYADRAWEALSLDLSNDVALLEPRALGMSPTTENPSDLSFLFDAEEYLLSLLDHALRLAVVRVSVALPPLPDADQPLPYLESCHPQERGRRVAETWHNHGSVEEMLPTLVAIEIYDALEILGVALADTLDETDVPREACGDFVRTLVEQAIQDWRGGEEASEQSQCRFPCQVAIQALSFRLPRLVIIKYIHSLRVYHKRTKPNQSFSPFTEQRFFRENEPLSRERGQGV